MKSFLDEYFHVVFYTICGILLILGSYNVLINVNHAAYLNKKTVVMDTDKQYQEYIQNVVQIENILNKKKHSQIKTALLYNLSLMKKDGAYRLLPGDKIGYGEVYNLNNYFIDTLINNGWTSSLKQVIKDNAEINNKYVENLIISSNYVSKELLNNTNYHYDVKNNEVRNTLEEEYRLVLNNYANYAYLLLNISNKLGDGNA